MKVKIIDSRIKRECISLEEYLDGRELVIERRDDNLWGASDGVVCNIGSDKFNAVKNFCRTVSSSKRIVRPPSEWSLMTTSERIGAALLCVIPPGIAISMPLTYLWFMS